MISVPQIPADPNPIILVVEDEPLISEMLCDVLEYEGLKAVAKPNADQALAFLMTESSRVSLILTDINMPGSINGAELAKHSQLSWPAIPIIVMSGMETRESAGICSQVIFIQKPFAMAEMVSVVRTLMGQGPAGPF